jgi:hypothetical protein
MARKRGYAEDFLRNLRRPGKPLFYGVFEGFCPSPRPSSRQLLTDAIGRVHSRLLSSCRQRRLTLPQDNPN